MKKVIYSLERVIEGLGRGVSLLSLLLALIIGVDVAMRYLFNFTKIWVIELETYCFTFLFLWGSAYAFKKDRHVRVDVFYQRLNDKGRAGFSFLLFQGLLDIVRSAQTLLQPGQQKEPSS